MKTTIFFLIIAIAATACNAQDAKDPKCLQPIVIGRCLAYGPRFAYDATKSECVEFIYGGCGGNGNRFASRLACEQVCKR